MKGRFFIFIYLFAGCVCAREHAGLVVTEVYARYNSSGAVAAVVFNDSLRIEGIRLKDVQGRASLEFPRYVTKGGKVYRQVTVLSEWLNREIVDAIRTGRVEKKAGPVLWEITRIVPGRRETGLKAFVRVRFNDSLDVECRLFQGRKGPWVSWPSQRDRVTKKRVKQVKMNRKLKEDIEQTIINKYNTLIEEMGSNSGGAEWEQAENQ